MEASLAVGAVLHLLLLQCASEPCEKEDRKMNESHIWTWLLDPARFVIFTVSLVLITLGSRRAVHLDKDSKESPDGVHTLNGWHICLIPVFGSFSLVIFFYFFDFIQFIFTIFSIFVSLVAMFNLIHPAIEASQVYCKENSLSTNALLQKAVSLTIAGVIAALWVLTGHWFYLDVLGAALCVTMIQLLRVPSLKLSTLLLIALVVYDVFWVFCSSSLFSENVMVAVATKQARNPVAVVADKLNLPDIAKSRPPLSIPGKLLVPSLTNNHAFAMLGLGDIVLPGLLLCFAMRFDSLCQPTGGASTTSQGWGKFRVCLQRWSYFGTALLGYAAGLVMASVVVDLTGAAQPALLYLVPGALLPLLLKASLQGDFRTMWDGPNFNPQPRTHHSVGKILPY